MAKLRVVLPAAIMLAISASALYAQQLNDPANLAGERVSPQDPADTLPINHGAAALQQLLLKLRTRASMMLIVAHPDDEDGGMLTYESRGQGARVAMLTLTRGEGGQNLMSADFDDALGLIRTQELLAADRYMGVDQMFGTEVDFGFSKTKEETLKKWTHERVLYDAVRAVRLYRPLVIASVFVGGPTDGHGHHQVAGEIAQEVFVAAADPKVFPEMIAQGLLPWAPLKVYARVPFSRVTADGMYDYATGRTIPPHFHNYVTGKDTTAEPTATVLIHEGERSTALGMDGDTYVQFARKGLALQKTQIGGNVRLAPSGALDVGYTLKASRVACINTKAGCSILSATASSLPATEESIFDGIDTTLPGIAALAITSPIDLRSSLKEIDQDVAEAQRLLGPNKPELTTAALQNALRTLDGLIRTVGGSQLSEQFAKANILHELRIKRVQLNNAIVLSLGVTMKPGIAPQEPGVIMPRDLVADERFRVDPQFSGQLDTRLLIKSVFLESPAGVLETGLQHQSNLTISAVIAPQPAPTRPYFSRPTLEQPFYDLSDPSLRNAPATPAPLIEHLSFEYEGVPLEMRAEVASQSQSAPMPLLVVPPVNVRLAPSMGITPIASAHQEPLVLKATVRATVDAAEEAVRLDVPPGWRAMPHEVPLTLLRAENAHDVTFTVTLPAGIAPGKPYLLTAAAKTGQQEYRESFRPVGYPGLTYTNYYTPATYRATAVDVHTAPGLRIAYLPGTGDTVADLLPNLGVTPTVLTPKDLTAANLKQYDAVILGVRAYAAQPSLAGPGSKPLLDYARHGGVVILQYMTARYGDAEAPFPIEVPGDSAHNVVEEAQQVRVLDPKSPVLTWPNTITSADFNHWVAERGHGFAASWSKEYTPLLETHDPEQDPQKGGLLVARVGKGRYVYCALALYRQLPEGVPGAYRLLANLISLGKNPNLSHKSARQRPLASGTLRR